MTYLDSLTVPIAHMYRSTFQIFKQHTLKQNRNKASTISGRQ